MPPRQPPSRLPEPTTFGHVVDLDALFDCHVALSSGDPAVAVTVIAPGLGGAVAAWARLAGSRWAVAGVSVTYSPALVRTYVTFGPPGGAEPRER